MGSADRKAVPLARGVLDYFPAALAAVAELSKSGNDKHNPGEDLHWARGKSTDHADCIARHLVDRGTIDPEDGKRHSTKTAWRALALLQEELEEQEGAPIPRGARVPPKFERTRSEIAYLTAKQLKKEGQDLNLASVLEGPRAKELWKFFATSPATVAPAPVENWPDNGCTAVQGPIGGYDRDNPCPDSNCPACRPSRFS